MSDLNRVDTQRFATISLIARLNQKAQGNFLLLLQISVQKTFASTLLWLPLGKQHLGEETQQRY